MTALALAAGLFSGLIGAMGLGGGTVLMMYLALFTKTPQLTAQGINLLFFLPIGLLAVTRYAQKQTIRWKTVLPIAAGGLLGAVPGIFSATAFGGGVTAKIFGGFLIVLGIKEIVCKRKKT